MAAKQVQEAIKDAAAAVFSLYRAAGLTKCQGENWRARAEAIAVREETDEERASYVLAFTTAAEHIVRGLVDVN